MSCRMDVDKRIGELEEIAWEDVGGRGMGVLRCGGELQESSSALLAASSVAILTGYPCCQAEPPTETDGPLGALAIARALAALGKRVTILTDECNAAPMQAAVASSASLYPAQCRGVAGGEGIALRCLPGGSVGAEGLAEELRLDCLVAIERPGPAVDGGYYTMRGRDMGATLPIARLEELLALGIPSVGIGDGGNELGMGKVLEQARQGVPLGSTIACVVPATHLIAAGVSNWGGWALAIALFLEARRSGAGGDEVEVALPTSAGEEGILGAVVGAGARDGVTGRAEATVDGLAWEVHVRVLERLRERLH